MKEFGEDDHPLISILKNINRPDISVDKWIKFYFDLCIKSNVNVPIEIEEKAKEMCQNKEKLYQYKQIINQNFEKIKHFVRPQ